MIVRNILLCVSLLALVVIGTDAVINSVPSDLNGPPPLETVKMWDLLYYDFPPHWPSSNPDFYNPEQVVATGLEVTHDRIFVATPRLFSGVPATLSSISRIDHGDSPALSAYPDWSHHAAGTKSYNCSDIGLVSVYRMKLDRCNRLWALDAGVSRSLEDFEVTCPPKILVYDTDTDNVVRRIDFPSEVVRGESLYTNLIIDDTTAKRENHCDDVFVYITDTVEPAIVVYDSGNDVTWRLSHPSMYPDPDFAESTIHEHKFTLMDGIVGIAFDRDANMIYYQPLATDRLFSVSTAALRSGPLQWGKELPVKLVGHKSSQGLGIACAPKGGTIFFSPFSATAIGEWNPLSNYQNVVAHDAERLQFVADLMAPSRDPGTLYILSSKFHRFFLKNLDSSEVNTRILRIRGVVYESPDDAEILPLVQQTIPVLATTSPPFKPRVPGFKNTFVLNHPLTPAHPGRPTSYIERYFGRSHLETPYNYEPVGVINKQVSSPFARLNMGEKPRPSSIPAPSSVQELHKFDGGNVLYTTKIEHHRGPPSRDYRGYRYTRHSNRQVLYNNGLNFAHLMCNNSMMPIGRTMHKFISLCLVIAPVLGQVSNLKSVAEWRDLEYEFPSAQLRENAIVQGKYVVGNGVPIDVDVAYRQSGGSLIFVTVPRFVEGIPITLGTITGMSTSNGPMIRAYPDYSWQSSHGKDCNGITSVFRVFVDKCKRLWVLDTGKIGDNQLCQPQILVFDVMTDQLIQRYRIPKDQFLANSLLVTIMVDVRNAPPLGRCDQTMAYVTDVTGFGLIVYDYKRHRSWRVQNKLFFPHPKYGTFNIKGDSFDLMDGALGLAISPQVMRTARGGYGLFYPAYDTQNDILPQTERLLFFHALASATENAVPLSLIDNATIWQNNPDDMPRSFREIGHRGTQSAAEATDGNGNLFFGLMNPIAIACWDTNTEYNKRNIKIVAQNDQTLQFASGLKIVLNGRGEEELWVLTSSFQKTMAGTRNFREINFRIQALQVHQLLGGTRCSGKDTSGFTFPDF
uniref:Putative major royal jelly protein n=1 Tax=Lutzomyia longipalpis TaxID=7200 RepID=A0A1B0CXD0_LUTLO